MSRLWEMEEPWDLQDRKASRKESRLASKRDRSRFKKSDQDQRKKQRENAPAEESSHLTRGRVLAIFPEGVLVACDHKQLLCTLKGSLKQDQMRMKNLVAVGDFVRIEEAGAEQGCIVAVEERRSILSRADNLSRNKEQLIAVNIDQVLITVSLVLPALKPFLIDRYIIAAYKGRMEPVILINKTDCLTAPPEGVDPGFVAQEKVLFTEFLETYRRLGIKVIPVSAQSGEGIEPLRDVMSGRTSVFSGQSGVGKSSLINLLTGSTLATGGIVQRTCKGSHTTSTTHLIPLLEGGFCIDTPGIKSFGLWDLQKEEVAAWFQEIFECSAGCKYPDCAHINEPDCAVKRAVGEEKISPLRFASYCALMASVSEEHLQR